MPPCFGGKQARDLVCVPGPHSRLHRVHTLQGLTVPSTGHGFTWQFLLADAAPLHGFPPNLGGVQTRVRDSFPGPHLALQAVNELHLDHLPSIGHGFTWQSRSSTSGVPQAFPPNLGGVHVRVLFCTPFPQDFEQDPYADHELNFPSTGHSLTLQALVWEKDPVHAAPPHLGGVHVRVRVCVPCPQNLLHAP